jgi:hypothetical protein
MDDGKVPLRTEIVTRTKRGFRGTNADPSGCSAVWARTPREAALGAPITEWS